VALVSWQQTWTWSLAVDDLRGLLAKEVPIVVRQSELLTPRSSDYLEFLDRGEMVYLPYGLRLAG